ncbi:hypothetical protein N7519_000438 [Penicillium mononematosum]|nr:uncharacterized protein N7519_000438 [Penicillium mononematosum]KAJ6190417.1 hypothetical protein N7519_000438 [Penicillium mononematosum]
MQSAALLEREVSDLRAENEKKKQKPGGSNRSTYTPATKKAFATFTAKN